jgi:hypothetical protein
MNSKFLYAASVAILFSVNNASSKEISTNSAIMQAMDKVTGVVNKISVPVNSKVSFGDFSLVLRACKKTPAEETPENFAFVDVADKSFGKDEYNIFRGWLISSTPGINAIEHPIYDVWLLECVDADISNVALLSKEELDERDMLPTKNILNKIVGVEEKKQDNKKAIHIKEFINEDIDIEKNIIEGDVSQEGVNDSISDEPQNLLNFTKEEEINSDEDLSSAIDQEIKALKE